MVILLNAFSLSMLERATHVLSVMPISIKEARGLVKDAAVISYVGHPDTAFIISEELGIVVPVNREKYLLKSDDVVIVAQYDGPRLPEGAKTLPEGAKISYWKIKTTA